MKLKVLKLENFRRFESLEIAFHEKLTVIVARNGQGKTSILDAATVALGTFVGAFDMGKAKHFYATDARYLRLSDSPESEQQYPLSVIASLSKPDITGFRLLSGKKNKTTIKDAKPITDYGKELMQQVRDLKEVELPVVAYYGSGRLWNIHKNMSRKAVLSESRTLGYEDCLSPASNFKQVQQWMAKATYAMAQHREMPEYSNYKFPDQLKGIESVVDKILAVEGWKNFHYSMMHEELAMHHDEHGILPVSLLSDGVRLMVSLVADIAWRCAKLNPHFGAEAPDKTQGIIFIDEVDMHLHPQWQQTVIGSLQAAFPNIQFIVTTHSPQVLSTVPAECIRIISHEINQETGKIESFAKPASVQSLGVASTDIMAELQGVDPVPNVEQARWLTLYRQLIMQNEYNSNDGRALKEKIVHHFGNTHQEWLECERLIRLQVMKSKLPRLKNKG